MIETGATTETRCENLIVGMYRRMKHRGVVTKIINTEKRKVKQNETGNFNKF